MRICKICNKEKDLNLFPSFMTKGKYRSYRRDCTECRNERRRKGRIYTDRRDGYKHKQWTKEVLERDGYKCQVCGSFESLIAHHIVEWDDSLELRFELSNGQTLCRGCHMRHHQSIKCNFPKNKAPWNKGLKTGKGGPKGQTFTPEHLAKLRKAKLGRKLSDEHKQKLKEAKTPENIELNKIRFKGKKWEKDVNTGKRIWID
jgi:5-methylcytosine-specific restriction endonuclease McrA